MRSLRARKLGGRRAAERELDDKLRQIVNRAGLRLPEEGLSHYTDWQGFEGIVRTQHVWAFDHRSMNDRAELLSANGIIEEASTSLLRSLTGGARYTLERFLGAYDEMQLDRRGDVYIACFTEAHDSAAQWQRYGRAGEGVCLHFAVVDEAQPPKPDPRIGRLWLRVTYTRDDCLLGLMNDFAEMLSLYEAFEERVGRRQSFIAVATMLFQRAAVAALTTKRAEYHEEREWRVVALVGAEDRRRVKVQKRRDGRRYLPMPLRVGRPALLDVVLGARNELVSGRDRVFDVLRAAGYEEGELPRVRMFGSPAL